MKDNEPCRNNFGVSGYKAKDARGKQFSGTSAVVKAIRRKAL